MVSEAVGVRSFMAYLLLVVVDSMVDPRGLGSPL